jgi:molecular chaperone DnaK (HSP70)
MSAYGFMTPPASARRGEGSLRHRIVGIDLGTTYSAIAAWDHELELAEILPNREEGAWRESRRSPSPEGWTP